MNSYEKVKDFITELGYEITAEVPEEEIIQISNESNAVLNMIVDCEDPILIFEQLIGKLGDGCGKYKKLLQMNRELVHGAFVLDESGEMLIFRDTLQLENLDINEVEGTLNAFTLAMAEFGNELITMLAK